MASLNSTQVLFICFRERSKRLQALQAIHKLDSEIRQARKTGRIARQTNMDARTRIQARRNQRQHYPPPVGIYRTIAPDAQREFIPREEIEDENEDEDEDILGDTIPFKDRPPLKVSCEFDRSDEVPRARVDYYSATRWKQADTSLPPPPPRIHSKHKSSSTSTSHMDRYRQREDRNVRGRLGEHKRERSHRENPKDTGRHRHSRRSTKDRLDERTRERRAVKDRIGAERIRERERERSRREPPPPPQRGIRRGNMVFVTDSEDSADEESEEEVVKIKKEKDDDEKWPKLSVHVQSDDDDTFDL